VHIQKINWKGQSRAHLCQRILNLLLHEVKIQNNGIGAFQAIGDGSKVGVGGAKRPVLDERLKGFV
jgi:hypothetical protein